jgi:hypothetical protein
MQLYKLFYKKCTYFNTFILFFTEYQLVTNYQIALFRKSE